MDSGLRVGATRRVGAVFPALSGRMKAQHQTDEQTDGTDRTDSNTDRDDVVGSGGRVTAVDPAPHELSGNLIFTADGLTPFFALDRAVKDADGSDTATIRFDGDVFDVTLYYQQSGLKPPDDPDFDFRLESLREFRIKFEERAEPGQRSGTFHIAPRWPDMESEGDGSTPSDTGITGVNIRVDGSNLPVDAYPQLLRRAARAFDVNPSYFGQGKIHPQSNIFAFEFYARINRDRSDKIVGMGGPLRRIFEHVDSTGGFRELREDDRDVEGYHHRVKVDSSGAAKLVSGHGYGKKIKHYHPEHPRSDPSDPLYHPKVGVSLQTNITAGGSVPWSNRDDLRRECDELLLNVLLWAGVPTRADGDVFVPDAYFGATESTRSRRLIDDPTPAIKRKQETVVFEGLTAQANTESDLDTVKVLADGGTSTPDGLADETGYSKRTIYRVIDRLDDLLRTSNGRVEFVSEYLADTVRSTLSDAKDAIQRDGQSGESSAFQRWANAHGVEVSDPDDARLQLRFGRVPGDVKDVLRAGFRAWEQSGRDPRRFRFGKARWKANGRPNYQVPILG